MEVEPELAALVLVGVEGGDSFDGAGVVAEEAEAVLGVLVDEEAGWERVGEEEVLGEEDGVDLGFQDDGGEFAGVDEEGGTGVEGEEVGVGVVAAGGELLGAEALEVPAGDDGGGARGGLVAGGEVGEAVGEVGEDRVLGVVVEVLLGGEDLVARGRVGKGDQAEEVWGVGVEDRVAPVAPVAHCQAIGGGGFKGDPLHGLAEAVIADGAVVRDRWALLWVFIGFGHVAFLVHSPLLSMEDGVGAGADLPGDGALVNDLPVHLWDSSIGGYAHFEGDIDSALATIPTASPLNYLDLVQYLTCPLTPLALGLSITDISALDPTIALNKVKGLRSGEIEHARSNYEGVLSSSANSGLIRIARKYVNELLRLQFNSSSFTEAVIISATVLATCGTDEYTAGPYAAFANAVTDFSFQNGVPTGLDQNAAAIVQKLLSAEAKFKALRESVV
jgi:hypothetical protein